MILGLGVSAQDIPNIQDANYPLVEVPIRDNAFIMVLQPVPDNSGDYTMTLCNKKSYCRQTSMQNNEIRYIGLFLEDVKPLLRLELNKTLTKDEWGKEQQNFRNMYANYMNAYDEMFGRLEAMDPLSDKK